MLLASQMLFRNCEALANGAISFNDYGSYHEMVIKTVESMLKASVVQAEANKLQAQADKVKADAQLEQLKKVKSADVSAGNVSKKILQETCIAQRDSAIQLKTDNAAKDKAAKDKADKELLQCLQNIG